MKEIHFDVLTIMVISASIKQLGQKAMTFFKSTWARQLKKVQLFYSRLLEGRVIARYFRLLGFYLITL